MTNLNAKPIVEAAPEKDPMWNERFTFARGDLNRKHVGPISAN
jgi:hypothetical protein